MAKKNPNAELEAEVEQILSEAEADEALAKAVKAAEADPYRFVVDYRNLRYVFSRSEKEEMATSWT